MAQGACCQPAGLPCVEVTEAQCAGVFFQGIYMGDGVQCADIDCDLDAIWSCCDGNVDPPGCITGLTESECLAISGRSPRAPAGCPAGLDCDPSSVGACCFADGSPCVQMDADACVGAGGCPQGPGISCSEINCDNASMSCCLPDGSCTSFGVTRSNCINGFLGTPHCPDGCPSSVDCTQDVFGACCLLDGTCTQTAGEPVCTAQLGVYQGDGTDCTDAGISCQEDVVLRECRGADPPTHEPGARHMTPNLCGLALFGYYRRPDNADEGNTMFGKYRLVTLHETRSTQVLFGDDQCRHHVGMFGMLPDGRVALAFCSRHNNRSALSFGGFVQQPDGVDDPNGILEQGHWAGIAATANPRTGEVHVGSHAEYVEIPV